MKYKEYGKTGKKVSVIGFGGMRFRKIDYKHSNDKYSFEKCAAIVRRAGELGINYFDTAPGYCDDKSEEIFGEAFKNMPNPFFISTKSGLSADPSSDDVRRRIEKSLKRLGVDRINFFHMWCIKTIEQYREVMKPGGPYEGALKAKDEGLIEYIVFSTHCNGEDIETIVNEGAFEGVTLGYNATNFLFRQKGIKAAYKKGLGVVTMNPLGGGVIPNNPKFYSFLKENEDETLAQAALKFNVSHKEITVALAGIECMEQLEENVKVGENVVQMTDERMAEISSRLRKDLDSLCTGCRYCAECPNEIEIPEFMDAYNMYILTGKKDKIINRLKYHWDIHKDSISKCVACGKCEKLCTQKIPIIERLNYIKSI